MIKTINDGIVTATFKNLNDCTTDEYNFIFTYEGIELLKYKVDGVRRKFLVDSLITEGKIIVPNDWIDTISGESVREFYKGYSFSAVINDETIRLVITRKYEVTGTPIVDTHISEELKFQNEETCIVKTFANLLGRVPHVKKVDLEIHFRTNYLEDIMTVAREFRKDDSIKIGDIVIDNCTSLSIGLDTNLISNIILAGNKIDLSETCDTKLDLKFFMRFDDETMSEVPDFSIEGKLEENIHCTTNCPSYKIRSGYLFKASEMALNEQ
jgi:hypothetical protein